MALYFELTKYMALYFELTKTHFFRMFFGNFSYTVSTPRLSEVKGLTNDL